MVRYLLLILALACAKAAPVAPSANYDHELAAPGVATLIRQAADRVDVGDYAGAEAILREVVPEPVDPEVASQELLAQGATAYELGDMEAAMVLWGQLVRDYPYTRSATRARGKLTELAVIGRPPASLEGVSWFQGDASWGPGTSLVVFWETWCPHCQREVPRLEAYQQGIEGLTVVGLTQMSRGVTEEQVHGFLAASGVSFANGLDDGAVTTAFAVTGIPAAAVVRDGVIIWRGHPGLLDAAKLTAMVAGQ